MISVSKERNTLYMEIIIYCIKLIIIPALTLLTVFAIVKIHNKNDSPTKETVSERPYIHYANNPNKTWEGISVTMLNPSQDKKSCINNLNPDNTIKEIQLLSSEQIVCDGRIYRGWLKTNVNLKTNTWYLCKIEYDSGRTEIGKYDQIFLTKHAEIVK